MIIGYITNLGKYTEGFLIGEWIAFPIDEDDLEEVLEHIGINEDYEEYFFTDWGSEFDGVAEYFGEYPQIDHVNEVAEQLESMRDYEKEVFEACVDYWGFEEAIEKDLNDVYFYPDITSQYDLGLYVVREFDYDLWKTLDDLNVIDYFDFEAYGRNYEMNVYDGGFSSYGWIERV